ncbi:type III secretion system cytoplasmic ring protein SctQ [Trinickia sp. NRRL B-1857]|uniref:type III secretion system cytoplasmic ring protein SctQ n=1 Tax=Trinickia sp. NRRL B-1857 TaxID=3162879 RepID=UPI003D2E899C
MSNSTMTQNGELGESHAAPRRSAPVRLRRIDAVAKTRQRLTQPHRAQCPLADGTFAELQIRESVQSTGQGLPLTTRFGPIIAFEYAPLLLAFTGVDTTHCATPSAHAALARYAFAALPPTFRDALGDPTAGTAPGCAPITAPLLSVALSVRLPSIGLSMRLAMTAATLDALLDSESWTRLPQPAAAPAWLRPLEAQIRLTAGDSIVPIATFDSLAHGDVVRLTTTPFDVTGRATLKLGAHLLRLRWIDSSRCFEVEDMTHTPNPLHEEPRDHAPQTTTSFAPIDPAAIPIRLSFLLGTLRLTIGEIANVRQGSLLQLRDGMPPQVVIEANGQPIGAGELVDLDGKLAVEVTRWPRACGPAATS